MKTRRVYSLIILVIGTEAEAEAEISLRKETIGQKERK
jgi:hypothetical protein